MGNATSMFNLMRNLGGSFGIAGATTYLFRRQQFHTHLLGADVTPFNPQTQVYLKGIQANMMAHGADPSHGHAPRVWNHLGNGAAAGLHAGLRGYVPGHVGGLPAGAAAAVHHEKAEAFERPGGDALAKLAMRCCTDSCMSSS